MQAVQEIRDIRTFSTDNRIVFLEHEPYENGFWLSSIFSALRVECHVFDKINLQKSIPKRKLFDPQILGFHF